MKFCIALIGAVLGTSVHAQDVVNDIENGEKLFSRQCVACHVVVDADGEKLAGRSGRVGPNLYNVTNSAMGAVEDFRYSNALIDANAAGLTWSTETVAEFLLDPSSYLKEAIEDPSARSKMSFRMRDEQDALDVAAYLASLGEAPQEEADMSDEEETASEN